MVNKRRYSTWEHSQEQFLLGTYIKISPDAAGAWVILDWRNKEKHLESALTLIQAKRRAEELVTKNPKLVQVG